MRKSEIPLSLKECLQQLLRLKLLRSGIVNTKVEVPSAVESKKILKLRKKIAKLMFKLYRKLKRKSHG